MAEYHSLRIKVAQLEKQMMAEVLRPERVLLFLKPGRLVLHHLSWWSSLTML
jgi:ATP-dependent RNA helicase DOB1